MISVSILQMQMLRCQRHFLMKIPWWELIMRVFGIPQYRICIVNIIKYLYLLYDIYFSMNHHLYIVYAKVIVKGYTFTT